MRMIQSSKVLVFVALATEISQKNWDFPCRIVHTGVGKVNAALVATEAIGQYKPELVINLGTAGTLDEKYRGVCEINSVIQRDFDTTPLAPRGIVPFQESPSEFRSKFGNFRCGTGDSFMTKKDSWAAENKIQLVDMELYSIAQACFRNETPWRGAKYVTDVVGQNSSSDWQDQLKVANVQLLNWFSENIGIYLLKSGL